MSFADGRYHVTYNGEIYNFVEIRNQLANRGHRFRSESDTEVILAAFAEWGEDCQDRFNGMWAFAIWDAEKQALFLSRDRFGKKPLFYAHLPDGRFAFASEMKALFPLLAQVRPNTALVRDTSRVMHYETTEECLVEGIQRFPPGYCGWLRQGDLKSRRWWHTLDHLVEVPSSYTQQVEQFRELFLDACRLRMRSDVPLGTALSGGLDSSATISAMAHIASHGKTERMGENWQHAFVASFPGTLLDESSYARMVTDNLGIEATVTAIDPLQALADLQRYLYLFEELYITSPIPFMLTYGSVKAHGISVTLDGHGADELFAGYPFNFLSALRDAGCNLEQAGQVLQAYYDAFPEDSAHYKKRPGKLLFLAKWHARRWIRQLKTGGREPFEKAFSTHHNWRRLDHLTRKLYQATHDTILPTLLRNYDRYSMANGVEIRMPFMDHRIVSLAFSLPWQAKLRNGYSKAIVRDALADLMPAEVAYRKTKLGFTSPIMDWMKGPLRELMLDIIASRSFNQCDLIRPDAVAAQIRAVIENENSNFDQGQTAWTMLNPYLWEQAVIKQEALV